MKSFIALITLSLVARAVVLNNLGFMDAVSKPLPGKISCDAFVRSLGGMPYRRILQQHLKPEIKKFGQGKSRRHRITITARPKYDGTSNEEFIWIPHSSGAIIFWSGCINENHFDQPLLYRTYPTYAMRPEVMESYRLQVGKIPCCHFVRDPDCLISKEY